MGLSGIKFHELVTCFTRGSTNFSFTQIKESLSASLTYAKDFVLGSGLFFPSTALICLATSGIIATARSNTCAFSI